MFLNKAKFAAKRTRLLADGAPIGGVRTLLALACCCFLALAALPERADGSGRDVAPWLQSLSAVVVDDAEAPGKPEVPPLATALQGPEVSDAGTAHRTATGRVASRPPNPCVEEHSGPRGPPA